MGFRTPDNYILPGTKQKFEKLLGRKICSGTQHGGWEYNVNGAFQWVRAEDPSVIHCDDQTHGGIIYLTPNAPLQSGTEFWKHKETGKTEIRDGIDKQNKDIYLTAQRQDAVHYFVDINPFDDGEFLFWSW